MELITLLAYLFVMAVIVIAFIKLGLKTIEFIWNNVGILLILLFLLILANI